MTSSAPKDTPTAKLLAEWFWTDRWIGSSAFLLPIEPRGLYREMLTQAWRRGAQLPNDHEAIRRAVGCTKQEWNRCWPKVSRFWRVFDGDILVNDTQLEIWTQALTAKQRASDRGRKGALGRHISSAQAPHKQNPRKKQAPLKHKPPSPSPDSSGERALLNGAGGSAPEEAIDADLDSGGVTNRDIGAFVKRFCELYSKHRHGAKYFIKTAQHVPLIRQLLLVFGAQRLEKIAIVLLTTTDEWVADTDRGIGILSTKASWIDGKIAEYESAHGEIQVAS